MIVFRKSLDPLLLELSGNGSEIDAHLRELGHDLAGLGQALLDRRQHLAVIAECIQGGSGHGIDGIGTNQFRGIEDVGILWILGARRSPQHPLHSRPALRQPLKARCGKNLLKALVGKLGIGNGRLAEERRNLLALRLRFGLAPPDLQLLVNQRVNAAHEEARHGGHALQVLAFSS